jgi:outer membrane protein
MSKGIIGAIAFLILSSVPVQAQESRALTLEEVLTLTSRHNPAYRRALTQIRSSGAEVRAGIGAFLPSLSASVGFNGNSQTTFSGTDDFGLPVDVAEGRTFNSSSTSQSLSSNVTIFDGLRNLNGLRASRSREEAAEYNADSELLRVRAEVTRRFFDAIRAHRAVTV